MLLLGFLLTALTAAPSHSGAPPAPESLGKDSYFAWQEAIGATPSIYAPAAFSWLEKESGRPLPKELAAEKDGILISVKEALEQTIAAEKAGDVEIGTTIGFDTWMAIPANINSVLKSVMFRWGKPLKHASGVTRRIDSIFASREDRIEESFGPGGYRSVSIRKNGGVVKDQADAFSVVLRGNEKDGFLVIGAFLQTVGPSPSTSYISIAQLRPLPNGGTDYRLTGRYTGQSYASLVGLELGRRQFGFNVTRIREELKAFVAEVVNLEKTGTIPERKPGQ